MNRKEFWQAAYLESLKIVVNNPSLRDKDDLLSYRIAANALKDFDVEFPENDNIVLPIADSEGFKLPDWVKPGAYCIDSKGNRREINFVGLDKDGIWNCRFDAYDCSLAVDDWDYVKFINQLKYP